MNAIVVEADETVDARPEYTTTTIPVPGQDESPVSNVDDADPAPYGYTKTGRIRKRPVKSAGGTGRMPASETQARAAAGLLAQTNILTALALQAFGLRLTAAAITDANESFETMARDALLADPALCRKILSAGTTGAKTALVLAYGTLGLAVYPVARDELRARREAAEQEEEQE